MDLKLKRVAAAVLSAGATLALPLALPASADGPVTKSYVVLPVVDVAPQPGDSAIACSHDSPENSPAPNPGGACFIVVAGGKIDVTIKDVAAPQVGGAYIWLDGSFNQTSDPTGLVCGSAQGITVPDDASYFEVLIGVANPDGNLPPALACGVPSPGTTGTVTVAGAVQPTGGSPAVATSSLGQSAAFRAHAARHATSPRSRTARGYRPL